MTIRQFTSDPVFRQRYWARNHVGWRHMDDTLPNAGHRALAEPGTRRRGHRSDHPERRPAAHQGRQRRRGQSARHLRAGGVPGLRLHDEPRRTGRAARGVNPGFIERAETVGGISGRWLPTRTPWSPIPHRSATSTARAAAACSSPISSTSARAFPKTVWTGIFADRRGRGAVGRGLVADGVLRLRFVRHAAAAGIPVAIVNRGRTRGDDLATVKVDGGCSEMLALLADELTPLRFRRDHRCRPPICMRKSLEGAGQRRIAWMKLPGT